MSTAPALPTDAHAAFAAPLRDRTAAAALALLPGIGPVRWRALITAHEGDSARAAAAIGAATSAWRRAIRDAAAYLDAPPPRTTVLLPGDAAYPPALLDLSDAPPLLWVLGDPAALAVAHRVAVVGTRQHSSSGAYTTRRLVASLRETGACIVSGMARGIDGVAHDSALREGLPTVAVLATGVDVPYPPQHRALHARIADAGAVVSEHPPGTAALPGAFPRRNRIIAALADCTVVVEAGARSGALITADVAADLGRTVAAVPGSIDALTAAGTNALLRDGAHVLASVEDLLPLVQSAPQGRSTAPRDRPRRQARPASASTASRPVEPVLDGDERLLWHALAEPALDEDVVAGRVGFPARRCAIALAGLELRGLVTTELTGAIRRVSGH